MIKQKSDDIKSVIIKSDIWQKLSVFVQIILAIFAIFAFISGLHIVQEFKQVGEIEIIVGEDCKLNDMKLTRGVNFIIVDNSLTKPIEIKLITLEGININVSPVILNEIGDRVTWNVTGSLGDFYINCNERKSKLSIIPPKYKKDYILIQEV